MNGNCLNNLGNIGDLLAGIGAILALIAALYAVYKTRQIFEYETLLKLLSDYRSKDMGNYVEKLWTVYRNECNEDESELVNFYIRDFYSNAREKREIHFERRMVSHYFQHMAILNKKRTLKTHIIKLMFQQNGLEIIPKIILPIEINALPYCTNKKYTKRIPTNLKIMLEFYNKSGPEKYIINPKKSGKPYKKRSSKKQYEIKYETQNISDYARYILLLKKSKNS